jgi:hypothetical protein
MVNTQQQSSIIIQGNKMNESARAFAGDSRRQVMALL